MEYVIDTTLEMGACVCDVPLDEICCSEAAITTVVMFCGHLVCVCVTRAGANYMDNVSVVVMLCL